MKPTPCRVLGVLGFLTLFLAAMQMTGCTSTPPQGRAAAVNSYVQGVLDYHAGKTDKAIKDLQLAVKQHADLVMAHSMLGDLYQTKQAYDEALTQYEITTRLDPYTFKNHYNLGLMEQLVGRISDAIESYLHALKLKPSDFLTTQNLGAAYLQANDNEKALEYAKRATELNPQSGPAWANLATVLEKTDHWKEAEADWRKVMELSEPNAEAGVSLALNLKHQHRFAESAAVLADVVKSSDTAPHRKLLGDAMFLEKKYDEALAEYGHALGDDPKYYPALNETGWLLITEYNQSLGLDEAKRTGALDAWKKSLTIKANQPRVRELLKTYAEKMAEPGK